MLEDETVDRIASRMSDEKSSLPPPSVTERYYTPYYLTDIKGKACEDQCVLFHSNRICVITIAPTHPVVAQKKKIVHIDFQVSNQINRLQNKVSGKAKRGGQWLMEMSPLCMVCCDDGSQHVLYSCVRGKLVEVNDSLIDDPNLLLEKPQAEGYIAIVLPKLGQSESQKNSLLTREQYDSKVMERQQKKNVETQVTSL